MKRTALKRTTPLARKTALRVRSRRLKATEAPAVEPGRDEWKRPRYGHCAVCGTPGRIIRRHVVREQHVRREGGDPWDLRNSLDLGAFFVCDCHANHHTASRRIPMPLISDAAVEYAVELFGDTYRAALYFASEYEGELA